MVSFSTGDRGEPKAMNTPSKPTTGKETVASPCIGSAGQSASDAPVTVAGGVASTRARSRSIVSHPLALATFGALNSGTELELDNEASIQPLKLTSTSGENLHDLFCDPNVFERDVENSMENLKIGESQPTVSDLLADLAIDVERKIKEWLQQESAIVVETHLVQMLVECLLRSVTNYEKFKSLRWKEEVNVSSNRVDLLLYHEVQTTGNDGEPKTEKHLLSISEWGIDRQARKFHSPPAAGIIGKAEKSIKAMWWSKNQEGQTYLSNMLEPNADVKFVGPVLYSTIVVQIIKGPKKERQNSTPAEFRSMLLADYMCSPELCGKDFRMVLLHRKWIHNYDAAASIDDVKSASNVLCKTFVAGMLWKHWLGEYQEYQDNANDQEDGELVYLSGHAFRYGNKVSYKWPAIHDDCPLACFSSLCFLILFFTFVYAFVDASY